MDEEVDELGTEEQQERFNRIVSQLGKTRKEVDMPAKRKYRGYPITIRKEGYFAYASGYNILRKTIREVKEAIDKLVFGESKTRR